MQKMDTKIIENVIYKIYVSCISKPSFPEPIAHSYSKNQRKKPEKKARKNSSPNLITGINLEFAICCGEVSHEEPPYTQIRDLGTPVGMSFREFLEKILTCREISMKIGGGV